MLLEHRQQQTTLGHRLFPLLGRLRIGDDPAPELHRNPLAGHHRAADHDRQVAQHLQQLEPYGHGNAEPVFAIPRARVVRSDRIGKDGNTVRAHIEGEGGGVRLKAMLFRAGDGPLAAALLDRTGPPLHLAGHVRAEEWNGSVTPTFFVSDAAPISCPTS